MTDEVVDISLAHMKKVKEALLERTKSYPISRQFNMRLIAKDTWMVIPYSPSTDVPCPFVLIGEEYALVIDTTDTPFNIRQYVEECVTDKPLKVANTHSHHDHTGNNYLFADREIFMSKVALEELQGSNLNYQPTIIEPGDKIDLGNREVEVIGIKPCHSPSSVMFLDKTSKILFTGDEIDDGQINLWGVPVETFKENIEMLIERRDKGEFTFICAPHNGAPVSAYVLDYYLENCNRVMQGIEGSEDKGSTSYLLNPFEPRGEETVNDRRWDPYTRRSEWMGTNINYNIDLIFNDQLATFEPKGVTKKMMEKDKKK